MFNHCSLSRSFVGSSTLCQSNRGILALLSLFVLCAIEQSCFLAEGGKGAVAACIVLQCVIVMAPPNKQAILNRLQAKKAKSTSSDLPIDFIAMAKKTEFEI